MNLDDYFDFLDIDDIRVKGTRIGIEHILYQYIHRGQTPETIASYYRTITLEQVYATILYYLHNQEQVMKYLSDWLAWSQKMRKQQQENPPSFVEKLRQLKAKKELANDIEIDVAVGVN
jgi:uncharacterized protein (DUF433 family)